MSEAHEALLSQMVIDRKVYFSATVRGEMFPGDTRAIYSAIAKRYEAGDDADLVTIVSDLQNLRPERVSSVLGMMPSAANWRHYQKAVIAEWRAEELRKLGIEIADRCGDADAVEWLYERLTELGDDGQIETHAAQKMVHEFVADTERRYKHRGKLPGLSTGIRDLDRLLLGLQDRMMYVIGARPNDGKTALAVTLIANLCRAGVSVGLISLESSHKEIMRRLAANVGPNTLIHLTTGYLTRDGDFGTVTDTAEAMYKWQLSIVDKARRLSDIRAKARELVRARGAQVVFVDYLQNIPQDNRSQTFLDHMNICSQAMKDLALELEVPMVVLAQLRRDAEGRRPMLSHLKETGKIEQDADAVVFIWHHDDRIDLDVAKHRDGPKGTIPVLFEGERMRFLSIE